MVLFVDQDARSGTEASQDTEAGRWIGRMFSRDVVSVLNCRVDRPWAALRKGKVLTEMWLADQLRPFGIRPKTIWIGETAARGYLEADFKEVFRRYIPKSMMAALIEDSKAAEQLMPKDIGNRERVRRAGKAGNW